MQDRTLSEFLSPADAARILDVNHKTIRELIYSGKLPAVRVGRLIRIKRTDLDAALEPVIGGDAA